MSRLKPLKPKKKVVQKKKPVKKSKPSKAQKSSKLAKVVEVATDPGFKETFLKAQEAVETVESMAIILGTTDDWKKLKVVAEVEHGSIEWYESRLREVREYYRATLFKLESLRDELQVITNEVKIYESIEKQRKVTDSSTPNGNL